MEYWDGGNASSGMKRDGRLWKYDFMTAWLIELNTLLGKLGIWGDGNMHYWEV
jgi:hypothetical protein